MTTKISSDIAKSLLGRYCSLFYCIICMHIHELWGCLNLRKAWRLFIWHRRVANKLKTIVNHLGVSKYPDVCQISRTSVNQIKFLELSFGTFFHSVNTSFMSHWSNDYVYMMNNTGSGICWSGVLDCLAIWVVS